MNLPSGVGRWLAVAAVVAVGGGGIGYALTTGDDDTGRPTPGGTASAPRSGSPSTDASRPQSPPSAGATGGAAAGVPTADPSLFRDAFDGSVTMRCAYDESGATGTVYIKGGKHLRVDYTYADGADGHVLKVGDAVYLWGAALPQGIKLDQAVGNHELDHMLDSISPEKLADQTNDATCTKYSGGRLVFAVPADIEFTEPPDHG